jgi:hypothetical protein
LVRDIERFFSSSIVVDIFFSFDRLRCNLMFS